jgi:pimeloyl-ACP methyl ester carboxylesterase
MTYHRLETKEGDRFYREAGAGELVLFLHCSSASSGADGQDVPLGGETRRRLPANDIRALQACVAQHRSDTSAALAALRAPLLAIAGTREPMLAAVRAFAERVAGRFLALEDGHHATAFLAAAEIVKAVERFLRQQDDAATALAQTNAE